MLALLLASHHKPVPLSTSRVGAEPVNSEILKTISSSPVSKETIPLPSTLILQCSLCHQLPMASIKSLVTSLPSKTSNLKTPLHDTCNAQESKPECLYRTPRLSLIPNDTQISHTPSLFLDNLIPTLSLMLMLLCCCDSPHLATCSFASSKGGQKKGAVRHQASKPRRPAGSLGRHRKSQARSLELECEQKWHTFRFGLLRLQ